MILTPLGIGSAYSAAPLSWTCNLLDGALLVDAAQQAMLQLRRLKLKADDLEGILITHLHGDHVFGFPFILAERSPESTPLRVLGPEGTKNRLSELCTLAFPNLDRSRMEVAELPITRESDGEIASFTILAIPNGHSEESLGYLITDSAGSRLAYTGDSAWGEGIRKLAARAETILTEMTFIDQEAPDHLTLNIHLPKLLECMLPNARVLLTHLSKPVKEYLAALKTLRRSLPQEDTWRLDRVELLKELQEYVL